MSWFAQEDKDPKAQRFTGRRNLGPLSPTFQSSVFGVTHTGGSEGVYSSRADKGGASKLSGRFKPDLNAGLDPKAQQESHFNEQYKKAAIKEELRNDYRNFVMNNNQRREEDLAAKRGDKEVHEQQAHAKRNENQKILNMKQQQSEQRIQYRQGLAAQIEETKNQKISTQEKTKEDNLKSTKPFFTPHYKKPQENMRDILNHQMTEREALRENQKVQKVKEREQINKSYSDYQTKLHETLQHKHSQRHDHKLQTQADMTDKITEKKLKSDQTKEEEKQVAQKAGQEYAQKVRENQDKRKERAKLYSTDLAAQLEEQTAYKEKQRQDKLAIPRGVLVGKEAAQKDLELKEQAWRNKQQEKKNYSHVLQENIVVKQAHQEKNRQKDQDIGSGGLNIGDYKGFDKEKVKAELALQLQEKEAQRERDRNQKTQEQELSRQQNQEYQDKLNKMQSDKAMKRKTETQDSYEHFILKKIANQDQEENQMQSARRELKELEDQKKRLAEEFEQKRGELKKNYPAM